LFVKILALASRFGLYGQAIAAHYISHELARRGHKVQLRVLGPIAKNFDQFKDPAYKLELRPTTLHKPSTGLHVLGQVMDMLRLQKEEDFDVVLCLDAGKAAVVGAAFGKQAGLNVCVMAWGNELEGLNSAQKGMLRNCDLIMPVSRWAKANLIEAGFDESAMKVLPPGVDRKLFSPLKTRPKEFGIVTVTRLQKGSGVEALIDVLKVLLDKGQDAFLTVIGTGPEAKILKGRTKKALLEGSVKFLGTVPHAQMPEVYRKHRIFALMPRAVSGILAPDVSLAMMEASSCGLGVVGTELGGIADSLRASNGTTVPTEAGTKMSEIFERVGGKLSIVVATEGAYGQSRSWAEVAEELEGIIDELIYD
jgi:glycosyltransferase involved in cell wall biosynthesis